MANPTITNYDVTPLLVIKQAISAVKTLLQDASAAVPKGAVLGEVLFDSGTVAADGGNTGDGTVVKDATTPILAGAQLGAYSIECITAGTNSATFRVTDPKGNVLGDVSVSGAGASATFSNQIKFAVTDGAADFAVGDLFTFTVGAGSGKLKRCDSTAVDGSQYPKYVLGEEVDATAGDRTGINVAKAGYVVADKLVFKGVETKDTVVNGKTFEDYLHERGIITVDADTYSGLDNQ